MTFELRRQRNELRMRRVRVASTEWVTPGYRRIVLEGPDLAGFDSPGADDHVKVFFPPEPGAALALPELGPDGIRPGDGPKPVAREYTPVAWGDGTLTLDFVVHGEGVASTWAERAEVGDEVGVGGPRGSLVVDGEPDWWLLAGDETALPAIRRHLATVPEGAPVRVIVQVTEPAREQQFAPRDGLEVTWVQAAGGAASTSALADAIEAEQPRSGGFAFVAAEQSIVKAAREVLVDEWGLRPEAFVVKGYWKHGDAEYHAPH